MARTCTVCKSPTLLHVDREILEGQKLVTIAHRHQLSVDAVERHKKHMRTALAKAASRAEERYEEGLLAQVQSIQNDLARLQAELEQGGDRRGALVAIKAKLDALEVSAKLTGAILTGSRSLTVNVEQQMSPQDAVAVAIEYLQLAGYQVTKPEAPGEVEGGQLVH